MISRFRTLRATGAVALLAALPTACAEWKAADSTLTTPWTAQVSPDNALPDYPRPQMVRKQWTNLNGLWDYAIQRKEDTRPEKFTGSILVPYAIESSLSGVKQPVSPDQRLWYRRTFQGSKGRKSRLLLHFGAVDWQAQVFVNGTKVGEHQGGYDPFTFDITDALKTDGSQQELVVSVWDPTDMSLHPRGKQSLNPQSIWYTAVTGIWQTVWLEQTPQSYIREISMVPDLDGKSVRLTVNSSISENFTATATLGENVWGGFRGIRAMRPVFLWNRLNPGRLTRPFCMTWRFASNPVIR